MRPINGQAVLNTQISISLRFLTLKHGYTAPNQQRQMKIGEKGGIQRKQNNQESRMILQIKTKKIKHLIHILNEKKTASMK